jgi:hypothetical protein
MKAHPIIIGLSISLIGYFAGSFIFFSMNNPFAWIADVPYWHPTQRAKLMFLLPSYFGANYFLARHLNGNERNQISNSLAAAQVLYMMAILLFLLIVDNK